MNSSNAAPPPKDKALAGFLGAFSLALGAPQLVAPDRVNELIGAHDNPRSRLTQRLVGAQELGAAAGIFANMPRPVSMIWSRVSGDVMHLGLLGLAAKNKKADRQRLTAAAAWVAGTAALDVFAALRLSRTDDATDEPGNLRVRAAVTVRKPREEVFEIWHDFENLPAFMGHLEDVTTTGEGRSHWKAKAPAGRTVEWDAEIVRERPNELIEWRSLEGADVQNSGTVWFIDAPRDQGTEIHLDMEYDAPGGKLGEALAKLFGEEPTQQAKDDLRRFKQVVETGEVVRSDGTPEGQNAGRHIKQRPAQPPEQEVAENSIEEGTRI